MAASKKVLIKSSATEGGYTEIVKAENAVEVGGTMAAGAVPTVQEDGETVEWGAGSGDMTKSIIINRLHDNLLYLHYLTDKNDHGLIDGFSDAFQDEDGVDTSESENEAYNSGADFYVLQQPRPVLTSGGTAISSGYYSSYTPDRAFGGNESTEWWASLTTAGAYIGYEFASEVTIEQITLKQNTSSNGSVSTDLEYWDGAAWQFAETLTWLDSTVDLQINTLSVPVTTTKFRLVDKEGCSGKWYVYEVSAKGALQDSNLISHAIEAETEPTEARLMVCIEHTGLTLTDETESNNDVRAYVSNDDGSGWDWVALETVMNLSTGKDIYAGSVDLTDRSDKTMRIKVSTHNGETANVHFWGICWS